MNKLECIVKRHSPELTPHPTATTARIKPLAGIKAVVFDVYGTLFISGTGDVGTASAIDATEALTQALVVSGFEGDLERAGSVGTELLHTEILEWHRAGKESGVDCPEVEITKVWKRVVDALCKTEALTSSKSDYEQIRQLALEYEMRINPCCPMPGAQETLRAIKEAGFVLGIVSNAQFYTPLLFSALLGASVEELGFDPECCIWSYRELKAKPSAALFPKLGHFLQIRHDVKPEETLYIGNDMLNDIYCASSAGCKTALFAGDQRSLRLRENDERCLALEPDAVVTSLVQLLEILECSKP